MDAKRRVGMVAPFVFGTPPSLAALFSDEHLIRDWCSQAIGFWRFSGVIFYKDIVAAVAPLVLFDLMVVRGVREWLGDVKNKFIKNIFYWFGLSVAYIFS